MNNAKENEKKAPDLFSNGQGHIVQKDGTLKEYTADTFTQEEKDKMNYDATVSRWEAMARSHGYDVDGGTKSSSGDYTLGFKTEVKEEIENLRNLIAKLDTLIDEYEQVIKNTEIYWEGIAADTLREIIRLDNVNIYKERSNTAKDVAKAIEVSIDNRISNTSKRANEISNMQTTTSGG